MMSVHDLAMLWLAFKSHLIDEHHKELDVWFKERKELDDMASIYTPTQPVQRKPTFEGFMDWLVERQIFEESEG